MNENVLSNNDAPVRAYAGREKQMLDRAAIVAVCLGEPQKKHAHSDAEVNTTLFVKPDCASVCSKEVLCIRSVAWIYYLISVIGQRGFILLECSCYMWSCNFNHPLWSVRSVFDTQEWFMILWANLAFKAALPTGFSRSSCSNTAESLLISIIIVLKAKLGTGLHKFRSTGCHLMS